ncbi:peptidase M4 [Corallococcus exiguus]|uniref:M4 family metallopeptidase n=1 Tax=Corallococcus TaxID=83461 RepID=UPI000EE35144|nr:MULTISPECIES: M4 family metallopeptidase [Corallococcus]NNB85984.1 peptidase M4 [Corallococcus exiguus]NNB93976.1 peptidase M4 [Corallococcus exiguus]NNC05009.1 peptidase M4 [Corallococcus exiguus]NPC46927.1 peptidase M4 [Corallococcus exiguus]RKH87411.1 peptidase M4 [Corallococcus sp. AB032C]
MVRTRFVSALLAFPLVACGVGDADINTQKDQQKPDEVAEVQNALSVIPGAQIVGTNADGTPHTIQGRLGQADRPLTGFAAADVHSAIAGSLPSIASLFRLSASDLQVRKISVDEQGVSHIRYAQTLNGLPVVGEELVVHVDSSGAIFGANGSARSGGAVSARPLVAAEAAQTAALRDTKGTGLATEGARLVYVRAEDGRLRLAYEVRVTGESELMPLRDRVYVDALNGATLLRVPEIHTALNRKLYSANNGTTTPGTLKRSEGQAAIGDAHVDTNYDMLGYTYDCYKTNFNRDSLNNAGQTLISTVHYSRNYVNAYWDGTQMVYGDGDGVNSIELGKDADVTVHELTHAVTENESNLTYSGQSGGLNEAMSDTFGAICESWKSGSWSTAADIWKVGEDVWTPGTAGDALRYMDDPAKDGASIDWAPNYSGQDVHYTSGVPNLAFALLAKGGTHPRGRSTVVVTGIGVQKAAQIWYYANANLYTAGTTYDQAKTWTIQAATALGYDAATQASVKAAWEAVGVGVTVPPPTCTALTNGVAKTGLSGAASSANYYCIDLPVSKASTYVMSGGTGDADMYIKFGSAPTTTSYDCRPYLSGNAETCSAAAKTAAGKMYIMVRGYSAYSGVSLKATY